MSATVSTQKAPPMFEFCKRKRWADLAVGELGDAILLILSSSCRILYCGNAVTELLGWRDEEILDLDLADLIIQEDQPIFRNNFNESVRGNTEMLSYVRFKPKSPFMTTNIQDLSSAMLFEIKGYPHFVPAMSLVQCQCFFAVAKPYPSRNMAMLNTFIDIKLENERLVQRLQVLRSRSNDSHLPGTFSKPAVALPRLSIDPNSRISESGDVSFGNYSAPGFDDMMISSPSRPGMDHTPFAGTLYGGAHPANTIEGDAPEDTNKKRKLNKAQGGSHHVCVTCGRTDSPEWRKGPQGPKTLCNACGLRWAKATRSTNNAPAE